MFNFRAYFWGNDVYINEKFKYSSNEILIAYLNDRRVKYILDADEPDKTCRDVGSKHRYAEKCKNDPIWQTYNRAYKAHYARYMKKKMTVVEFEEWSRFASEIRDRALAGEIPFELYYTDIRK